MLKLKDITKENAKEIGLLLAEEYIDAETEGAVYLEKVQKRIIYLLAKLKKEIKLEMISGLNLYGVAVNTNKYTIYYIDEEEI